ncbi:DUF2919 domain-containing protein [Shewanella gelidii]|nr:DUF2919 domain-containing protein [Shewanella gelidii]MCL1098357.1 DUF2919 domain-containing protein [Shewanella gelidii]
MNFSHIKWLDDRGHVKPPIFLYLMLAFLARGWCVWIMSLTQFNDRAGLVRLIYPQKEEFLLALASGFGAALLYGVVLAERKRTLTWPRYIFRQLRVILLLLLLVDGGILVQRLVHADFLFNWSFGFDALFLFWCSLYLVKSKHLQLYRSDW